MAMALQAGGQLALHPGAQTRFAMTPSDLAVYGGAAGGGKSFGLLYEFFRHMQNPAYRGVIFRETTTEIKRPAGLWETAYDMFVPLGARPRESASYLDFTWPSGSKLQLSHLDKPASWQGSGVAYFGFDEITEFTARQFWYVALSRGRTLSGVRPYVRATCNPDPDSFVRELIDWWIGEEGFPIEPRCGRLRWFYRIEDRLYWYDQKQEAIDAHPEMRNPVNGEPIAPKSLTFIPAKLEDNPTLELANPEYRAGLMALDRVSQERLVKGNWNVRESAGEVFQRAKAVLVDREEVPADNKVTIRYFDKAGTKEGTGARTAAVRMSRDYQGRYWVEHTSAKRMNPVERNLWMLALAKGDPEGTVFWMEQEPASSGKESAQESVRQFAPLEAYYETSTGSKLERARGLAAQWHAGNVYVVKAGWTEGYLDEMDRFDGKHGLMDLVDASSGAFHKLATTGKTGSRRY